MNKKLVVVAALVFGVAGLMLANTVKAQDANATDNSVVNADNAVVNADTAAPAAPAVPAAPAAEAAPTGNAAQ